MRAVRILIEQPTASYRIRQSLEIKESYPLPPYSTVIGMIHAACGFQEYVPLQVSIQGDVVSHVQELYTRYEFGNGTKYEPPSGNFTRHNVKIHTEDRDYGILKSVGKAELLVDVTLVIHIVPEDDSMCEIIMEGLRYPKKYLSLGRHEDLAVIREIQMTELIETWLEEPMKLGNSAWIPEFIEKRWRKESDTAAIGTSYRLTKRFEVTKKNLRKWTEIVTAKFAGRETEICEGATVVLDKLPMNGKNGAMPVFLN